MLWLVEKKKYTTFVSLKIPFDTWIQKKIDVRKCLENISLLIQRLHYGIYTNYETFKHVLS